MNEKFKQILVESLQNYPGAAEIALSGLEKYIFLLQVIDVLTELDWLDMTIFNRTTETFSVICSDTFAWGGADCEEITDEKDLEELKKAFYDCGRTQHIYGGCLYAARRRNRLPQSAFLETISDPWTKQMFEEAANYKG